MNYNQCNVTIAVKMVKIIQHVPKFPYRYAYL